MPEISSRTLVVVIQAVAAEIRTLREAVVDGDASEEEMLLLEERLQAADELERAYAAAARTEINLPAYGDLVRHTEVDESL